MRSAAIIILLIGAAAPVSAASLPDFKGTVDASTPTMIDKARHAAHEAGYQPIAVQFVQDGNVFLTATRGHQVYGVVLTRSGKFYASNGIPEPASSPAG
jgi:hypothetical protein